MKNANPVYGAGIWTHNLQIGSPHPINTVYNRASVIVVFILFLLQPVWPDLAIYWTLGNFLKPLATINLPKSPTFLGNFVKCQNLKFF